MAQDSVTNPFSVATGQPEASLNANTKAKNSDHELDREDIIFEDPCNRTGCVYGVDNNVQVRASAHRTSTGQARDTDMIRWNAIMATQEIYKSPDLLRREDLLHKEFQNLEAAEEFFNIYARLVGFSVRKGQKRKRGDGVVRYRTWMCCKQRERDKKYLQKNDRVREPRQISREGCKVQFRVNLHKKTARWRVKEFITEHSHPVALQQHVNYLKSNRKISKPTETTVKIMRRSGMKTSRIMSYLAQLAGGYDKVGFWPKDLQNCVAQDGFRHLANTDAAAAIGYLQHKAEHDVGFFGKYTCDDEMRLHNLFWADSKCQQAYKDFGDALAFDTTYKCNQYKNPLTILVGTNHHWSTSIFAFALLADETLETYTWVLETFLECMDGKQPDTVVTDGDLAMRSAIAKKLPKSVHRLCSWHIQQNAIANVKDPNFLSWLTRLMHRNYGEINFDKVWCAGVAKFGLENNEWVASLYERRRSWADSYLRGNFFAGMLTTQRCEGMHAYLKMKVDKSTSLTAFVCLMDLGLSWQRMMESKNDFELREYRPQVPTTVLHSIETQASEIFTRKMFHMVRDEMRREGQYLATKVEVDGDTIHIKLVKYGNENKFRQVSKSISTNTFSCQCKLYPTKGIPCRHIFASMKALHITKLPVSLIMQRWLKNEQAGRGSYRESSAAGVCHATNHDQDSRFGVVTAKCTEMAYYASLSEKCMNIAVVELDKLTNLLQGLTKTSCASKSQERVVDGPELQIKNPKPKKTKGAPATKGKKNLRICSTCKQPGHNKATCDRAKKGANFGDGHSPSSNFGRYTDIPDDATDVAKEHREETNAKKDKCDESACSFRSMIGNATMMEDCTQEQCQQTTLSDTDAWLGKPYGQCPL